VDLAGHSRTVGTDDPNAAIHATVTAPHKIGCELRGVNVEEAHDLTDFAAVMPPREPISESQRQAAHDTTLLGQC
jgi:hypothetical protein